jgi:hypothetical protein
VIGHGPQMFEYRIFNHDVLFSSHGAQHLAMRRQHPSVKKNAADALAAQQGMVSAIVAGEN